MKIPKPASCLYVFIIFFTMYTSKVVAQKVMKFETIRSVRDIPHATPRQKWMWIHRSIVFAFLKERKPTHDTSWYSTYRHTVITLPVTTRFINFKLRDVATSAFLKFEPNNQYDIGVGVTTRYAGFVINTGVPVSSGKSTTRGNTRYKDYQLNLYGKRSTVDLALQTYKGFYVQNANDFENYRLSSQLPYHLRPDVSAYALGVNYYHLFNSKRFSYRSSFAFNGRQKKSAGSPLLGGYTSLFGVNADSALVSAPFEPYFTAPGIKSASIFNFGVNVGYIYTLLIRKKLYATLSLVQGIGMSKTATRTENNALFREGFRFASKQNVRMAFGYDNKNFFAGTMGIFDFHYFNNKHTASFNYSSGKFRIFAGYRFPMEKQEKKWLRKLNLIDYRL